MRLRFSIDKNASCQTKSMVDIHQPTMVTMTEVQDILAASILHSPSLRFTDLSGDDIAFHVPEKGQRGMEARGEIIWQTWDRTH